MADVNALLDYIIEAQRGDGQEKLQLDTSSYICTGFWLSDDDMKFIREDIKANQGHPDVGEVGRYLSVPVFPVADRLKRITEDDHWGHYDGVWFSFIPMGCVD